MIEISYNLIITPILVYIFVGIDRDKWISWNKNKRKFFFISWIVMAAILIGNNLYIFVLGSIILFFTELYL